MDNVTLKTGVIMWKIQLYITGINDILTLDCNNISLYYLYVLIE